LKVIIQSFLDKFQLVVLMLEIVNKFTVVWHMQKFKSLISFVYLTHGSTEEFVDLFKHTNFFGKHFLDITTSTLQEDSL